MSVGVIKSTLLECKKIYNVFPIRYAFLAEKRRDTVIVMSLWYI